MASVTVDGEYFGQIPPPLSVTIKGILDKYPDGQIFKELIQNADDAGATEVTFILDHRDLPTLSPNLVDSRAQSLLSNFQGPALLSYNDAVFTDSDWEGIRNLQQSGKVKDPFKVGKFGIGFNSVYHITDLPVIISGRNCVYLDPQEHIWRDRSTGKFSPGRKFDLTNLHRNTDVLDAFNNVCGFRSGLKNFPATLFRYPLRKSASRLSDNCYTPQMMHSLITPFREEAKYLLLFLRFVKKISFTCLYENYKEKKLFEVVLNETDSDEQCPKRKSFIDQVCSIFEGKPLYNVSEIILSISSCDVVVKDEKIGESHHHWLVAQQVGSTDPQVREQAARQHVLPWVGTAIEVNVASDSSNDSGRLFCSLPMPCETTAPIPVHINGTFAMSDNRRAPKWPAEERQNDPQAKWNKLLVEYCLPSCYVKLVLKVIEMGAATPDEVYMAWPDAERLKNDKEWRGILEPFFLELFRHKVVYSDIDDGCWIRVQDAVFVPHDKTVSPVVEMVLLRCKVKVTGVNRVVWSAFNYIESVKTITPKFVRQILKKNAQAYQSFTSSEKLDLLEYCLKDNDFCDLIGLKLLPIVSGEFVQFSTLFQSSCRYLCSTQVPKTLLPYSQDLLVDPCDNDSSFLYKQLKKVASHKCTQLVSMTVEHVAHLLNLMPLSEFSSEWLKVFWEWVQPCYLYLFEDLSIVPVGIVGHEMIAKLSESAGVVFVPLDKEVTSCFAATLAKYNVQLTIEERYSYMSLSLELMNYLHQLDGPGVLDAISSVCSLPLKNVGLTSEEALVLQEFFDDNYRLIFQKRKMRILRELDIFHTLQHPRGPLCHINKVMKSNPATGKAIVENDKFDFDHGFIPQAPLVISRVNNQTRLLSVLGDIVVSMNKMRYLCQVLLPMISCGAYPEAKIEPFMVGILKDFDNFNEKYPHQMKELIDLLKELQFLQILNGDWNCPTKLYDPSSTDLVRLFKGQDVFPVRSFIDKRCLVSLKKCGLRGPNSVNAQCIVNIIQEIGIPTESVDHSCCKPCDSVSYERAQAALKFLDRLDLSSTCGIKQNRKISLQDALAALRSNYAWLPVHSAHPSDYPSWLPWKGSPYKHHFASSHTVVVALDTDIEQSDYPIIMGSEVLFVHSVLRSTLAKLLSSSKKCLVKAVLAQLNIVIAKVNNPNKKILSIISSAAYEFLNNATSHEESDDDDEEEMTIIKHNIKAYHNLPFIFTGKDFIKPSQFSRNRKFNGPYLYSLPRIIEDKKYLLDALGVKAHFEAVDLFRALKNMYEDEGDKVLSRQCCELVNKIMSALNECNLPNEINTDVYLPDESYTLHRASDLSIKELWCIEGNYVFVSERLNRSAAIAIGVKTVSNRFLQTYHSSSFYRVPFGQSEDLTCRIKNILRKCPFDEENATLLKELIQNADDAKATKMCVILDRRTHGHNRVLSEHWSDLQGPALLVWNDADFTDSDLKGIQQLGLGSKQDDSESIGQFGIGFNVVYHITDCPSFITGGKTLCILDPHCRYAPGATKIDPGRRYDNLDEKFWKTFSDLKSAYLRDALPGLPSELLGGLLFRFPLRHTLGLMSRSELIEHDKNKSMMLIDADKMEQSLHCWMPQIKEALLFLNHVTQFSFYVISDDQSCHKYCYEVEIDDYDKPKRIKFHQNAKQFHETKTPALVTYCLSITSTSDNDDTTNEEEWLVQQGVGDIEETAQDWSFSNCIAPKHGLAALLSASKMSNFKGKAFCFLPLPINTNLPVHVNGQFILSSNRRSLWTSNENDDKNLWNQKLVKAISSSYARFLITARQYFVQLRKKRVSTEWLHIALSRYYQLFPYWELQHKSLSPSRLAQGHGEERTTAKRVLSGNPEGKWKLLGVLVFKKLWANNAEILASIGHHESDQATDSKIKWCILHNEDDPYSQAYFSPFLLQNDESMQQLLTKIGMTITTAPSHLQRHFEMLRYKPSVCSSEGVFHFFTKYHEKILPSSFPTPIVDTAFKSSNEMVKFTLYITKLTNDGKYREYHSSPFGYPLLLTADGCIIAFDSQNKVIDSQFTDLFAKDLSKFLHPNMVKRLSDKYFSSNESFDIGSILRRNFSQKLFDTEQVDNTDGCLTPWRKLQRLWECLCCDLVFKQHQKSIVEQFTIIPTTEQHLFSTRSPVLPLVAPDGDTKSSQCESHAFQLLKLLGLPIFDASKLLSSSLHTVQSHCVKMSEKSRVLETLYHFHTQTGALINVPDDEMAEASNTLFNYFKHIFFREDRNSTEYVKSLPLFKTINGTYKAIDEKEVYSWPDECCEAGYDKWANSETVVFLENSGEWNCLDLPIVQLSSSDLYIKFIFPAFGDLNTSERMKHLLYIRDSILKSVSVVDKSELLTKMKEVACLEDLRSNRLLPISHFSDPHITIFRTFSIHFIFPSEEYNDDKWLKFFRKLGLKTKLMVKEFIRLCKVVANGNHPEQDVASDELLKYLFEVLRSKVSSEELVEIGNIFFVRPDPLPRLNWIKTPCAPVNSNLQLTTLRGAAVSSCANLVWTVMPVVKVIWQEQQEANLNYFIRNLDMITSPSDEQIFNNILSMSKTALADFKLFQSYNPKLVCDSDKADIVSVMCANLEALHQVCADKLKDLVKVACIPVSADGTDDSKKFVLVNSLQVVWSLDKLEKYLQPYINELPISMHLPQILKKVGVTRKIEAKHLEYMLQTIHCQIGSGKIQTNQLLKVRIAVLKLCDQDNEQKEALTELYLPCHEQTLVKSTNLLVDDSQRYSNVFDLNFQSPYKLFLLPPPDTASHIVSTAKSVYSERISESDVCLLLPDKLRPKIFSESVEEKITKDACVIIETDLCKQLLEMLQFHEQIQRILSQSNCLQDEVRKQQIATQIGTILEKVKVQAVLNLQADLFLTLESPPAILGTKKVPFLFSVKQDGTYLLSVDSRESAPGSLRFWRELSHCLCIQAAKISNSRPTDCLLFCKCLSELLRIKCESDLEEVAHEFSVTLDDIDTPYCLPKLGQPLHGYDCHQDINHIFGAQEWVGYESKEDQFIYAIILHPIQPEKHIELKVMRSYQVRFGKKEEDCAQISALDLYKLIDHVVGPTHTKKLVPLTDSKSAFADVKMIDNQILMELKKNICCDLKLVWDLPKDSRNKAVKRLYLNYHPDKAEPEEAEIYDDAFKFLLKQIENLDAGLELDNPSAESSLPSAVQQFPWNNFYRAWNETARNMYRGRRKKIWTNKDKPSNLQPAPNKLEAKRWLRQAEADYSSLKVLLDKLQTETKTASMLCFVAYQIVEKALKACMYLLFGLDQSCLQHNQLVYLAQAVYSKMSTSQTRELCTIATALEDHYLKSLYPDAHSHSIAPVDVYSVQEARQCAVYAETALMTTKQLLGELSVKVEKLQEEKESLQRMLRERDGRDFVDVGVQFSYLVPMSAHLRGVHVVGEKLFEISGEFPQLLEWEEYGLRIQVPEGATSEPCDIAIKAIVAGQFEFPEGTDLVSAVYAISVSKRLAKPVMLEIQHCVAITREGQGRFLSFVRAQCNQPQLPYQFELLDNGTFPSHSGYGKIACDRFSLLAVLRGLLFSGVSNIQQAQPYASSTEDSEEDDGDFQGSQSDNETLPVDQPASQPANQDNRGDSVLERTSGKQNTTSVANIVHEDNQSSEVRTGDEEDDAVLPPMKYSLYVFHINKARNSWMWHFNVTKDLNALIQYVQQSHTNWQNGIHLPFQYSETELLLQFEAEHSYQGWQIRPSIRPCTFLKHVVDDWNHSIPYCRKVKVIAQEGPDTAPFIDYPVLIRGTTEEDMSIVIQEQLQTTDPVIQPAAQAPPDHDRSTAHLALQNPPTIPDLLNKVAAKASNKWKKLGHQLFIEHHKLKTISRENDDSLDCYAEVFELWQKRGSPPYTWATIIDALRADIVGEVQLACELEQWVMST